MYSGYLRYQIPLIICIRLLCMAEDSTITVGIQENIAVGSVVFHLFNLIVPRPAKDTTYTLMKNPYFSIKDQDKVVIIGDVDRDSDAHLCLERNQNHSCVWKTILLCSNSAPLVLKVVIFDQNDNSPRWVFASTSVDVTENTSSDLFKLELPKADDPDESPNNTAQYTIDPPSKYVFIDIEVTPTGITPFLKLRQAIDREVLSTHNVTVVAVDGGSPPRSGSFVLLIQIIDVNDNSPVFQSSIYTHSLRNDVRIGDRLDLKIRATDADDHANGRVSYSLPLTTPHLIRTCFSLDPLSAEIVVQLPLAAQCLLPRYDFRVTASDHGNPTLSSQTSVSLTFDVQNSYAPDIQMSNKEPNIYVFENNDIGSHLRTFAVKDKDSGKSGDFQCAIEGVKRNKVAISSNSSHLGEITILHLVAMTVFDREKEAKLFLSIVCKDFGTPPLTSFKNLIVTVLDTNDNSPYFEEALYHFKSFEDNEPYQKLAQLTARDNDEGNNAQLTYHIESATDEEIKSRLTIDVNGHIIAKERLDREKFPNGLNFSVIATDHGRPPLQGSTEVHLELLDINDNDPEFEQENYNFSVVEDIGSKFRSRVVGQVSAVDADSSNNSLVRYVLAALRPVPFKLNPETGQLYSYSLIDRETQAHDFVFSVLAMDNPDNLLYRRTALVTVSVDIKDVNDNSPTFIFPNDENNRVHIAYSSPIGSLVTAVKAMDKDDGQNAEITYSLVDPERNILFSINKHSGELTTSTVLNSIHEGVENLFIRASDSGTPPLTTVQRLVIEIGEHKSPLSGNTGESFLSDQATYIIVGIVLGTFFICCGLVAGICTMTYRHWRSSRNRTLADRRYAAVGVPTNEQMHADNYLEMKEII